MKTSVHSLNTQEKLNFLVTNRIPRQLATQFIGWFSKIESPLLTRVSIAIWSLFSEDLRLQDAKKTEFKSLQECFTRELKDGLRTIDSDADTVISPCDAVVGEFGKIQGKTVLQAKGFPYDLNELIPDRNLCERYKNGTFITLRLKSSMYHRFHAPVDCNVKKVNYISGDTWNVNPVALKRVEKLFCKNERATIQLNTNENSGSITLVPVAAILVACMKFNFLPEPLDLKYKGPNSIACNADFKKGDEMGYFQHGSTIILFASEGYDLVDEIDIGYRVNMGQALLTGHNR
jgi:phosphatidylserine decarboxylase